MLQDIANYSDDIFSNNTEDALEGQYEPNAVSIRCIKTIFSNNQ